MRRFVMGVVFSFAFSMTSCSISVDAHDLDLDSGDVIYLRAESSLGPYSAAVVADDFCFVSGKIGQRGGSFELEVNSALDEVEKELKRVGLDLSDIVFVTVYLTDIDQYAEFNDIYAGRFSEPYPSRACVAVSALPAGARVEIQIIACLTE